MSRSAPSPIHHAGLGLVLLLSAGSIFSCATRATRTEQQLRATAAIEDPIRLLQARAELETLKPLPPADDALIRELVRDDTPPLTPGTEAHRKALMSAEEIEIGAQIVITQPQDSIDLVRQGHAAKLYTRARMLRQQGRPQDASGVLMQAMELDPNAPELAAALGAVRVELGDPVGANEAYERAIELGDRSGTTLVYVASQAYTLGNDERVMTLCSIALEYDEIERDPVARVLAGIMLGNAQIRTGYLRAGAQSLEEALTAFDPSIRDPRWRQETIQILGRRAGLWVIAGDAWSRVGAHARAASAYAQAAQLSEGATTGLTARQIAAKLRDGHPASAALLLIEHLQTHPGQAGWQEARWVRTLSKMNSLRGLLSDAIASLRTATDQPLSVRRSLLKLELVGTTPDQALERITQAQADGHNPGALLSVLRTIESPQAQTRWALQLVERNPAIANALSDSLNATGTPVLERLNTIKADNAAGQLLRSALALRLGRADLLFHLDALSVSDLANQSAQWLETHAQAAALTGRWDTARTLGDELSDRAQQGDSSAKRAAAELMMLLQQPDRAASLAQELAAAPDATSDDLLLLARIELSRENADAAVEALETAQQIDMYDDRVSDRLIRLFGNGGPLSDETKLRDVIRELGERRPNSDLFMLLRAGDLARNGLLSEAESMLVEINQHRDADLLGEDLLLSIWKTQQSRNDPEALNRGADWLTRRLAKSPNAIRTGLALAQIRYEQDAYDQSLELLTGLWERTGSYEVARVRENLIANELEDPERARQLIDERLGSRNGIDPSLEYANALSSRGDADSAKQAVDLLAENIPAQVTLLPAQQRQLEQVVYSMAEHAETAGIDDAMLSMVELIESRTGPLDFFMARTKLLLLTRKAQIDIDALLSLIEDYTQRFEDNPENVRVLRSLPVQVLLGEDRPHEAIVIVTRLALSESTLREDALIEVFRLLGGVGENTDLLGVIDAFEDAGVMQAAIERTTVMLGTPQRPISGLSEDQQRADLAYTAGAMASAFERPEQAKTYLALALSFDPEHGWSNNDLGYMLTEAGERIADATEMLETAARVLPNEASVIDSLGWLRYKMGILEDEIDPQTGEVSRRGAISILARANRLDTERSNATILEHLGDALWRAGRKEQAIEAWLSGENMLRSRIRTLSAQPEPNRRAIEAASAELRGLRYRIQDAEAGGEPKIAPIFDEPSGS